MPKRHCTNRAEWRLLRGKPAQPLPAHYQLDCEYGTALITIYKEGEGDNPVYLCKHHAAAMATVDDRSRSDANVRDTSVTAAAVGSLEPKLGGNSPIAVDSGTSAAEIASSNPSAAAPGEPVEAAVAMVSPARIHSPAPSQPVDCPAATVASGNVSSPSTELEHEPPNKNGSTSEAGRYETLKPSAPAPSEASTPSAPVPSEVVDSSVATAAKAARAKTKAARINSSAKSSARDLTYGNPAKALVDETIWNLATGDCEAYRTALREGKSALDAAQAAGGQLAVVHRKIHEYGAKIEALLSESKAAINVDEVIQSVLERETLKIIGNDSIGEAEKDAAVDHLGSLQESFNRGLKRDITPLQAHRIALAIADRANWGAASCSISNELRPVYRVVYTSVKEAIRAAVPGVRDLDERLCNLYAARSDLEAVPNSPVSAAGDPHVTASVASPAPEQKFAEM